MFIYSPNFKAFQSDPDLSDTLVEAVKRKGDSNVRPYNVIYTPPLKIKPKFLTRNIFIEQGKKYNALDVEQTYKKLSELRINKHVSLDFRESKQPEENPGMNNLDCSIRITRQPVHSYSIEAQGTNSGGDLGIGGSLVYRK